jgi:DNA polymerase
MTDEQQDRDRGRWALAARLESLNRAGVRQLARPKRREPAPSPAPRMAESAATEPATTAVKAVHVARSAGLFDAQPIAGDSLAAVQQEVAACRLCDELCDSRTQTVFGVGNPHARLCFLGEAPGADEDRLGEPFVGRAGQLLTKIIEACTLKRPDVYILNVLKCRPPENRTPLPHEVANCRSFLDRQLALIKPGFLCCLGAVAAQTLLETEKPIGRLRGTVHDYRGIKVVCTYHPAYLLRNPAAKKDCWEDMKLLLGEMGITLGGSN